MITFFGDYKLTRLMAENPPNLPKLPIDNPSKRIGDNQDINKPSVLIFKNPVPRAMAEPLTARVITELLPELKKGFPEHANTFSIDSIFDEEGKLVAYDFFVELVPPIKNKIKDRLMRYIYLIGRDLEVNAIQQTDGVPGITLDGTKPVSFTELLGTYRVKITRFYIPIIICIIAATTIAWLATYKAGLEINAAMVDPEESSTTGILLNALVPVLISAAFITGIYFIVKKFGLNSFKYIFGVLVLFYVWFGFTFIVDIIYIIGWEKIPDAKYDIYHWFFYILYYALYIGSALLVIIAGRRFFKNQLIVSQKNVIVLLFGIFLGSIIGISFPTWTMLAFAIFLSVWDLIAVFKGPLGKIANMIVDNRKQLQQELEEKAARGEITQEQLEAAGSFYSLQNQEMTEEDFKEHMDEFEIELGSGDLILYSALVAHTFVFTTNWVITVLVIIGVMSGAIMTLFFLVKKRRVLPALPFSMLFGVIFYLIGAYQYGLL